MFAQVVYIGAPLAGECKTIQKFVLQVNISAIAISVSHILRFVDNGYRIRVGKIGFIIGSVGVVNRENSWIRERIRKRAKSCIVSFYAAIFRIGYRYTGANVKVF